MNLRHGHNTRAFRSRTYRAWVGMRSRCKYQYLDSYPRYGGRGIAVCDRWRSFDAFLADMGEAPAGTSLDRIDTNGHYEPGNCRWATGAEQNANKRSNRNITYAGRTQHLMAWSREIGAPYQALYRAIVTRRQPVEQVFAYFVTGAP